MCSHTNAPYSLGQNNLSRDAHQAVDEALKQAKTNRCAIVIVKEEKLQEITTTTTMQDLLDRLEAEEWRSRIAEERYLNEAKRAQFAEDQLAAEKKLRQHADARLLATMHKYKSVDGQLKQLDNNLAHVFEKEAGTRRWILVMLALMVSFFLALVVV